MSASTSSYSLTAVQCLSTTGFRCFPVLSFESPCELCCREFRSQAMTPSPACELALIAFPITPSMTLCADGVQANRSSAMSARSSLTIHASSFCSSGDNPLSSEPVRSVFPISEMLLVQRLSSCHKISNRDKAVDAGALRPVSIEGVDAILIRNAVRDVLFRDVVWQENNPPDKMCNTHRCVSGALLYNFSSCTTWPS